MPEFDSVVQKNRAIHAPDNDFRKLSKLVQ